MLASNGDVYGCLSNSRHHPMRDLLELPEHEALAELQQRLGLALQDKQDLSFSGEVTVMKFIGG